MVQQYSYFLANWTSDWNQALFVDFKSRYLWMEKHKYFQYHKYYHCFIPEFIFVYLLNFAIKLTTILFVFNLYICVSIFFLTDVLPSVHEKRSRDKHISISNRRDLMLSSNEVKQLFLIWGLTFHNFLFLFRIHNLIYYLE